MLIHFDLVVFMNKANVPKFMEFGKDHDIAAVVGAVE